MRSLVLACLLLLLPAAPVLAQGEGGQMRIPLGWTPESFKKYSALQQQVNDAFTNRDHDTGLGLLRQQMEILEETWKKIEAKEVDLQGKDKPVKAMMRSWMSGNWYNQACCLSLTEQPDEAIAALKKSIELGWMDLDHMKLDKDLDPIREMPAYRAIIDSLNYNDAAEIYIPEDLGAEEQAPLILALHSSLGNEKDFAELWKGLARSRRTILAAPRGPVTMEPGKFAWKRQSDDEDAALKKILATIEAVKAKHPINADRVFVIGLGQGGYFATLAALKHPGIVKGAVPINAYWNKYYFEDFLADAKAKGAKICFVHGKDDPFRKKAGEGEAQLKKAEIKTQLLEFEGGRDLPEDKSGIEKLVRDAIVFLTGA